MKSANNRITITAPQPKPTNRLRCQHHRGVPLTGPVRTIIDDSGSLAITAWRCALCRDLIEEIHILSPDGTAQPYAIRHAAVPHVTTRRFAALAALR
jgi:hypothetical protein